MLGQFVKRASVVLSLVIVFHDPLVWGQQPASDPTSLPSLHDTRLAVQARNALIADPTLVPLVDSSQIGVRVRQNVATLFGSVPSKEIADKAVECLRNMQKLQVLAEVRSELEVVPPKLDPRAFKEKVEQKDKATLQPPIPRGELASRELKEKTPRKAASPHVDLKGPGDLRIGDDAPPSPEPETVKLLAPVPSEGEQGDRANSSLVRILSPKPLPPERSLYSQIEDLRKKDDRYATLRVRVEGTVVYVSPSNAENLFDFAESVSRVKGVQRVVVER